MRRDHTVASQSEEFIARLAMSLRRYGAIFSYWVFDIVKFIEGPLTERFREKDPLRIELYDRSSATEKIPAYVEFKPNLKLCVRRDIWEGAKKGIPHARFVLAHEIGHLVLHDHHAKAFSNDEHANLKFVPPEESAEWQANTFAKYFLAPDNILQQFNDPRQMMKECKVPEHLAFSRLEEKKTSAKKREQIYQNKIENSVSGQACPECGDFTLFLDDDQMTCNNCNKSTGRQ